MGNKYNKYGQINFLYYKTYYVQKSSTKKKGCGRKFHYAKWCRANERVYTKAPVKQRGVDKSPIKQKGVDKTPFKQRNLYKFKIK